MSATGERLLARMQQTKNGWRPRDLAKLYSAFGFEQEEGKKHTLYTHSKYPTLMATVTRGSSVLPTGYVDTAVKLVEQLKGLEGKH